MKFWAPNQIVTQDHQYNTLGEIIGLAHKTLEFLECAHLVDKIDIQWNRRFTKRLADASYSKRRIRLSIVLWPRANVSERHNTIIHEICHITVGNKYPRAKAHGQEWRWEMPQVRIEARK